MTPEGYANIIKHEGEVLSVYQDSLGVWTIGCGHNVDPKHNGAIPQRISRMLLEDDIAYATACARSHYDWFDALDPVRQDVIIELIFNMGIGGLDSFKRLLGAMAAKDYQEASWQLANSLWARQVSPARKADMCNILADGKGASERRVA